MPQERFDACAASALVAPACAARAFVAPACAASACAASAHAPRSEAALSLGTLDRSWCTAGRRPGCRAAWWACAQYEEVCEGGTKEVGNREFGVGVGGGGRGGVGGGEGRGTGLEGASTWELQAREQRSSHANHHHPPQPATICVYHQSTRRVCARQSRLCTCACMRVCYSQLAAIPTLCYECRLTPHARGVGIAPHFGGY
eukprot:351879-Chlamydomonas_euryale.AAC.1